MSLFSNKVAGLQPGHFFLKKAPVQVLTIKFCQNQPQNVSIDSVFSVLLQIFLDQTLLFCGSPWQLAMTELIYH